MRGSPVGVWCSVTRNRGTRRRLKAGACNEECNGRDGCADAPSLSLSSVPDHLDAVELDVHSPSKCGIDNPGQLCYMIATFQLITNTVAVRRWACGELNSSNSKEEARAIAMVVRALVRGDKTGADDALRSIQHLLFVRIDDFSGERRWNLFDNTQDDAGMFLNLAGGSVTKETFRAELDQDATRKLRRLQRRRSNFSNEDGGHADGEQIAATGFFGGQDVDYIGITDVASDP